VDRWGQTTPEVFDRAEVFDREYEDVRIVEFGAENKDTILLFHGGGLLWWNYRESAKLLQNEYHIVLPILDGHAGSDRPFSTIEENASEIISFIDAHLSGAVLLIGGLSLGGQVLLELLSQRGDICTHAPMH
jgi:pimeloyl-ACP methyl ester carboxylesterase